MKKALEKHIKECKHRIEIVKEYMLLHKDADVPYCMGNIKEWETVILALEKQIPKKSKRRYRGICKVLQSAYMPIMRQKVHRRKFK